MAVIHLMQPYPARNRAHCRQTDRLVTLIDDFKPANHEVAAVKTSYNTDLHLRFLIEQFEHIYLCGTLKSRGILYLIKAAHRPATVEFAAIHRHVERRRGSITLCQLCKRFHRYMHLRH